MLTLLGRYGRGQSISKVKKKGSKPFTTLHLNNNYDYNFVEGFWMDYALRFLPANTVGRDEAACLPHNLTASNGCDRYGRGFSDDQESKGDQEKTEGLLHCRQLKSSVGGSTWVFLVETSLKEGPVSRIAIEAESELFSWLARLVVFVPAQNPVSLRRVFFLSLRFPCVIHSFVCVSFSDRP